jgi:ornithine carbamoyltransferase
MANQVRHLLSIGDFTPAEIHELLNRALEMKRGVQSEVLRGRSVALLFEKPSLRTKVSFDLAAYQLGGHAVYLSPEEVGLGVREPVSDVAKVLSEYVDVLVARTVTHASLVELSNAASIPVINALSDLEHPCQALADMLTIREIKPYPQILTVAFVGDGNNVANSLALAACSLGFEFRIASPEGYEITEAIQNQVRKLVDNYGGSYRQMRSPMDAVASADVVYTDVWASMGQESERERRRKDFTGYCVTPELMSYAARGAMFMHDLPSHPGEEISPGMLEHPQSVVFQQAANRLHAQKAVIEKLMINVDD